MCGNPRIQRSYPSTRLVSFLEWYVIVLVAGFSFVSAPVWRAGLSVFEVSLFFSWRLLLQVIGSALITVEDEQNPLNNDIIRVVVSLPRTAFFSRSVREAPVNGKLLVELLFADEQ